MDKSHGFLFLKPAQCRIIPEISTNAQFIEVYDIFFFLASLVSSVLRITRKLKKFKSNMKNSKSVLATGVKLALISLIRVKYSFNIPDICISSKIPETIENLLEIQLY
jgi:hypothetical protein